MSLNNKKDKNRLNSVIHSISKNDCGQHQKGFSLIEVMVSLLLISIGLMSMVALQVRSVSNSTVAYTETQSTLYLQEIVEHLRVNKAAAVNGDYNIVLSSLSDLPSTGKTIAEGDRYSWFYNLNNVLTSAKASIDCDATSQCVLQLQYDVSGTIKKHSVAVIL